MLSWTLHQKGSPKESNHGAVVVRHQLYYFGTSTEENNEDEIGVHVFNTLTLLWRRLTPVISGRGKPHAEVPSRRRGHTAVLIEDIVYLWGGSLYNCNMLYAFDVDAHTWFKPHVYGTFPEGRWNHSACVLGKVMFIHGGYHRPTGYTNDIYKLDTSTMVWSVINARGTPPPASSQHSATIIGTKMFVFGGWRYRHYNPISVFDTETNLWLDTPSAQPLPEGHWCHSAFTYNGELYIFGGSCEEGDLNDLWRFSPETFSLKRFKPKGEGPSLASRMSCCMVGDRVILFGGYNASDDLYILDFSPSLKTLCKLAVIQYGVEQSGLPHNIRWELAAMTSNSN